MVVHRALPQYQITTNYSGSSYVHTNDQFISGQITRLLNGFDTATLWMNDYESRNYLAKVDADEDIKIEFKDEGDASWVTIFDGIVRFINTPLSMEGEVLELKCDGAGYGFGETNCCEEYGVQSSNPTKDHFGEVIDDANVGIIPKYVNKILGSASASGHSYTVTTNAGTGTYQYIYYPYKTCLQAINDVLDLEQATRGSGTAGLHWIVLPSDAFHCTQIGNHSAGAAAAGWTTYYGGSQAEATLVQGKDFLNFNFQKLAKEANYILYAGAFRKPADGDVWTENNSGDWGNMLGSIATTDATISDINANPSPKANSYSIQAQGDTVGAAQWSFYYPSTKNMSLDLTKIGGRHNIPSIGFWARYDNNVDPAAMILHVYLGTYVNDADITGFATTCDNFMPDAATAGGDDKWSFINIPLWGQTTEGWGIYRLAGASDPSWTDIDFICFFSSSKAGQQGKVWIDGLRLDGFLLRAAYEAGIGAANKLRMKIITDDVGKDDSLSAADDSGTIAQLAYAELLRSQTTPIVGYVTVPYLKDLLPGQLLHIHAKKKKGYKIDDASAFNINKDMRVTKLLQFFGPKTGFQTKIWLTDDVKNSNCRPAYDDINRMLSAVRPEFQDRQASSIKARKIDITQTRLEKSY